MDSGARDRRLHRASTPGLGLGAVRRAALGEVGLAAAALAAHGQHRRP